MSHIEPASVAPENYAVFTGRINQQTATALAAHIIQATVSGVKRCHILFQSFGGTVGDGIFLYNFLRNSTVCVRLYNGGNVESIASIAYLGAKERVASANSAFMFHHAAKPIAAMTAAQMPAVGASLQMDDARIDDILKLHVVFTPEQGTHFRNAELWFSAKDAIASGIALEEGDFRPPVGEKIQYLGGLFT